MKIGLFNDSFPPKIDGVANAVYNYAKYINEEHGEAIVVTPWYPNVKDNYDFKVYRYSSITTFDMLPYRVGNPISPLTLKELIDEDMDILHIHSPFASSLIAKNQEIFEPHKKPMVLTYHTKFDIDIDKYIKEKAANKLAKKFILKNINMADEVWCVTEGAGKWLRKTGYKGDYTVMPNGTDFPKGRATDEDIRYIKSRYGIAERVPVFMFCGRMIWYKNLKLLLNAAGIVREKGINFRLLMIGDGGDLPEIKAHARKVGVFDNCIFTGAIHDREELRKLFSAADLFLFPSTFDTSGLVVKEAAACACPSLLIKDSCASDGITDGYNGFLSEENAKDYAKKITDIINSGERLKTCGINAQNTVYYSWRDSVSAAYDRYGLVLENFNRQKEKQ